MRVSSSIVFLVGASGLSLGACDGAGDSSFTPPVASFSVAPIFLPDLDDPYRFNLAVTGPSGFRYERAGLRAALYGTKRAEVNYIGSCDASADGLNRVELSVERDPGQRTHRLAPRLLLPETRLGVRCSQDKDTYLEQRMVAAELEERPTETLVRFDDVRCVATQRCAAEGNAMEVRCSRPGERAVALGIRDARLVCGGLEDAVDPLGSTASRLGVTTVTRDLSGEDAAWRAEVSPADLPGCTLEAELVAAADLAAGRAPACHAWPVLEVALPLGKACEARPQVAVAFEEAGGPPVDELVQSRAHRATPPTAPESQCAALPLGLAAPSAAPGATGRQGFLDLHLQLVLPR